MFSARTHLSLSLFLSLRLLSFCSARAHTSLSLCICSVYVQRAHTHIFLSLHLLSLCSVRGREEQSLIRLNTDIMLLASLILHASIAKIPAQLLSLFYLIRQRLDYKDFCADLHLVKESWLCSLNGSRFNHFFIFIPLSDNRNSKIYLWKQFYWEFSCIKIQYVGTERQTNVIISNICYVHFACSEEVCCPFLQICKQVCVSKLLTNKISAV